MDRRDAETQSLHIKRNKVSPFDAYLVFLKNLGVSASRRLIFFVCAVAACSVPNLEPPECTASRDVVKEFYSFHFGNDMKFSQENLNLREKFLTPEFTASLKDAQTEDDVFTTNSADIPKAFRTAVCEVIAPDKTVFTVVLFWRDDTRSEQKEIKVKTTKQNGEWLIGKVIN